MHVANVAAGIVVGKRGTATATPGGNAAANAGDGDGARLRRRIARGRKSAARGMGREGLTVGFTNGCFDILHAGHVSLLRQAAAACDRLIVALNTDASVRRLKGPERPVQSDTCARR